jgi:splicing factor 3B subunit 1
MSEEPTTAPPAKKHRWGDDASGTAPTEPVRVSRWGAAGATPARADAAAAAGLHTPHAHQTPSRWAGPDPTPTMHTGNWAAGPYGTMTPTVAYSQQQGSAMGLQTPAGPFTGATPNVVIGSKTPMHSQFVAPSADAIEAKAAQLRKQWLLQNRHLTDEYLAGIFPAGYEVAPPPPSYQPKPTDEPNFFEQASRSVEVLAAAASTAGGAVKAAISYEIPDDMGEGMPKMKDSDAEPFILLLQYHNVDPLPDEVAPAVIILRNLLKIKNGDAAQRRLGMRYLTEKAHILGAGVLVEHILHVWLRCKDMSVAEQHHLVELLKAVIARLGKAVASTTKAIVQCVQTMLSHKESILRDEGRDALALLTRVVGIGAVFDAVKEDFVHSDDAIRRTTAKVVAIFAYATTPEEAMPVLKGMARSNVAQVRHTAVRAIQEMTLLIGHQVLKVLHDLAQLFETLLKDEYRVKGESASALCLVAEKCSPYGIEELGVLVPIVREECRRSTGRVATAFLRAFGSLVPLMPPQHAQQNTESIMDALVQQFKTTDEEMSRALLHVVRQCVNADGVTAQYIRNTILQRFLEGFWTLRRMSLERKSSVALIETTVDIAKKIGSSELLEQLGPDMKDENESFQRMVVETVTKLVVTAGTERLSDSSVAKLVDSAISAVQMDALGTNRLLMEGLAAVCKSLGPRLRRFNQELSRLVRLRLDMPQPEVRQQAGELIARIAPALTQAGGTLMLTALGRTLFEKLQEKDKGPLAAYIKATRVILHEVGHDKYQPSVKELLKALTYVIHNQDPTVQLQAVQLIEYIATLRDSDVEEIHLDELGSKIVHLLDGERRETRRACAQTFGTIAERIGPLRIVLQLVDNFRQEDRKIRICTGVAIGVVALKCKPFLVVPFLINEYRQCEGQQVAQIVQHSVLKAVRYMFEFVGSKGREYVYPLIPLLQRAITETEMQHRRMAIEAARAAIMSVVGFDGFSGAALHLLNMCHPNIIEMLARPSSTKGLEERYKLVTAVVGFYEAARLVLGSQVLLQYFLQGLFHAARDVRDIYWRAYNILLVGNPEALIPAYPTVEDDNNKRLKRHELFVII